MKPDTLEKQCVSVYCIMYIACNKEWEDCWYSEDLTEGNPAYCTSCDINKKAIYYPEEDPPTWEGYVKQGYTLTFISNKMIMGVKDVFTKHGAQSMEGDMKDDFMDQMELPTNMTDQKDFIPQGSGNMTGGTMPGGGNMTGGSMPGGGNMPNMTMPNMTMPNMTMPSEEDLKDASLDLDQEFMIDGKMIEHILDEKLGKDGLDEEAACSQRVGEDKEPHKDRDVKIIALKCPDNCDKCSVSEAGGICWDIPSGDFKVQDWKVVENWDRIGYFEVPDHKGWWRCDPTGGCKTWSLQQVQGAPGTEPMTMPVCQEWLTEFGFVPDTSSNSSGMSLKCKQKCTNAGEYWNDSLQQWDECASDWLKCHKDKCIRCKNNKVMVKNGDSITCEDNCQAKHYPDSYGICRECDASWAECKGKGPNKCTQCADPAHSLFAPKELEFEMQNEEAIHDMKMGKSNGEDYIMKDESKIIINFINIYIIFK
jgi:hypothetical protein